MVVNTLSGIFINIVKKVDPFLRVPFIAAIDYVISSSANFNSLSSFIQAVPALFLVFPLLFVGAGHLVFIYIYCIGLDVILVTTYFTVGAYLPEVQNLIIEADKKALLNDGVLCYLLILGIIATIGQIYSLPQPICLTISIALSMVLGLQGWIFGVLFYIASEIFGMHENLKETLLFAVHLIREEGISTTVFYYYQTRKISTVLRMFWLLTTLIKFLFKENARFNTHWLLVSVAASCDTRLRLLGISLWLPEISYLVLWISRGFLDWTLGHTAEDLEPRDISKALVFYLIASMNSITDIEILERLFFLILLMFISFSYILQSVVKLTDRALKSLSTSIQNRYTAHVRAITMMLFLMWVVLYSSYKFCMLFSFHVWQLIVVSSNIVTAIQALSSVAIYVLFMYDLQASTNFIDLDDGVYYITALTNTFEFLSAFMVLSFGLWNVIHGSWTIVGLIIIIFHTYYNLWLKARDAWKIFLSRRSAAIKLKCLVTATKEELEGLQDLCPICFDSMMEAKITQCGHYFHSKCLRKWLYIQSSCPLCHQDVLVDKVKED